jgi:hypothetical protein
MVELQLPELREPVTQLRIDLADAPGYLRLHELAVLSHVGNVIWLWNGDPRIFTSRHDLAYFSGSADAVWLSTSHDPFLEIPLPATALELLSGARIQVGISWPLSTDYALATSAITEAGERWAAQQDALTRRISSLETKVLTLGGQVQTLGDQVQTLGDQVLTLGEQAREIRRLAEEQRKDRQTQRTMADSLAAASTGLEQQAAAIQSLSRRLIDLESPRGFRAMLRRGRATLLRPLIVFDALPYRDLRGPGPTWESTGDDPAFELTPRGARFPSGWVRLDFQLEPEAPLLSPPCLYVDSGEGYGEGSRMLLPGPDAGSVRAVLKLPQAVRSLRFDPLDCPGRFRLGWLRAQEIGTLEARLRLARGVH